MLQRALGPHGFDAARDIDGITCNRWSHGYALEYMRPWDQFWPDGPLPVETARKPWGRVAIANFGLRGLCLCPLRHRSGGQAVHDLLGERATLTDYSRFPGPRWRCWIWWSRSFCAEPDAVARIRYLAAGGRPSMNSISLRRQVTNRRTCRSNGTCLRLKRRLSITSGRGSDPFESIGNRPRAGSQATRYQSGGRTSMAWRLDTAIADDPLCVAVLEAEDCRWRKAVSNAEKECRLQCRQVGYVHQREKLPHIEAVEKPAQVAHLVRGQCLFDLGEPGIREGRKRVDCPRPASMRTLTRSAKTSLTESRGVPVSTWGSSCRPPPPPVLNEMNEPSSRSLPMSRRNRAPSTHQAPSPVVRRSMCHCGGGCARWRHGEIDRS